jgi:RNA polymerase sigma-70 factor (ECF subfamily)
MTEVIRRAAAGDPPAVEALLVAAQELAWRFSMSVCGHPEDAEDAMQDTLVQTFRKVGQIRDPDAFRPWIYRTVRNACLMSRRRRVAEPSRLASLDELLPGRDESLATQVPSSRPTPEDLAIDGRRSRALKRAMRQLPPPFRAVVFLRDMEGLSTRETAATLGLSEDNVKARLHRARLFLRQTLEDPRVPGRSGARAARVGGHRRKAGHP